MDGYAMTQAFKALEAGSPCGIIMYTIMMFFCVWGAIDIVRHIWIGFVSREKVSKEKEIT